MAIPFSQLSFPEAYEQALVGPLFQPWAELTVRQMDLGPGDRVLDIACGTGIVARLAKEAVGDQGVVVGVDLSPPMIAVARRSALAIDWREGDAGALPLQPGETFDVVFCQQGLQFFPDRAAAVREMHRALARAGRVAVSTWRPDTEFPFLYTLRKIAESHIGPIDDRRHSLGERGALESLFQAAGFRDIVCSTVTRTIRFADGSAFIRLNALALVGMSAASKSMSEAEREEALSAIVRSSTEAARSSTDASGLAYELATNLLTASK